MRRKGIASTPRAPLPGATLADEWYSEPPSLGSIASHPACESKNRQVGMEVVWEKTWVKAISVPGTSPHEPPSGDLLLARNHLAAKWALVLSVKLLPSLNFTVSTVQERGVIDWSYDSVTGVTKGEQTMVFVLDFGNLKIFIFRSLFLAENALRYCKTVI